MDTLKYASFSLKLYIVESRIIKGFVFRYVGNVGICNCEHSFIDVFK